MSSSQLYTTTTTATNSHIISNMHISSKHKFIVLGDEVYIDSPYVNAHLGIIISSINILGKEFYVDIQKQGVVLPNELIEFLDKKFKYIERDLKINKILSNG